MLSIRSLFIHSLYYSSHSLPSLLFLSLFILSLYYSSQSLSSLSLLFLSLFTLSHSLSSLSLIFLSLFIHSLYYCSHSLSVLGKVTKLPLQYGALLCYLTYFNVDWYITGNSCFFGQLQCSSSCLYSHAETHCGRVSVYSKVRTPAVMASQGEDKRSFSTWKYGHYFSFVDHKDKNIVKCKLCGGLEQRAVAWSSGLSFCTL